jgi:NADPH:quinone reductase-like Zn-dependent oxidoreductase
VNYKKVVITAFGSKDVLKVVNESDLPEPQSGEVRVILEATSACFTDVTIREGKYPEVKSKPPFSPGYDLVGWIDALGEGVSDWQVGDRVAALTVTGAYSEYLCLPADQLVPVPGELDAAEAVSMILSYMTAFQMLHRVAKVRKGQSILVHGAAGAVGTALLQLGKLLDLKMYGTVSSGKKELVESLGATAIDYQKENFVERIEALTRDGVDVVFDGIGGDYYSHSFDCLRPNGKLVGFGFYKSMMGQGGSIPLDFMRLFWFNIFPNKRSTAFYSITGMQKKHMDWFREDMKVLFDMLKEGRIKPVIARRLPLDQAAKAHELIETRQIEGKIVLLPGI